MKALNIIVLLAGLFAAVNSYAAGTVLMENTGLLGLRARTDTPQSISA